MNKSTKKVIGILGISLLMSSTVVAQSGNRQDKPKERPSIKQLFKDLDTNKDGKLSLKEVKGPLKKDFKKIDTNEDGFITKKELKNTPKPERREQPRN